MERGREAERSETGLPIPERAEAGFSKKKKEEKERGQKKAGSTERKEI